MSIDGREQRLSRTFSDCGPRINAQLTKLWIQTHPLAVRGRYGFFVFGANTVAIISTFIGRSFSFFQRCANLFPVLRQKVGDVPLRDNFEQHRDHENVILIEPWGFFSERKISSLFISKVMNLLEAKNVSLPEQISSLTLKNTWLTSRPIAVRLMLSSCGCRPNFPATSTTTLIHVQGIKGRKSVTTSCRLWKATRIRPSLKQLLQTITLIKLPKIYKNRSTTGIIKTNMTWLTYYVAAVIN